MKKKATIAVKEKKMFSLFANIGINIFFLMKKPSARKMKRYYLDVVEKNHAFCHENLNFAPNGGISGLRGAFVDTSPAIVT